MKNNIDRLNYQNLRTETYVEYHETANRIIEEYNPDVLGIRLQYNVYRPLLGDAESLLDAIRKSSLTPDIYQQDGVRDNAFRGSSDMVKGMLNHFDPGKSIIAEKLWNVFENYGNIAAKTLDDESAAIDDLIRELRTSENTNYLNTLGLMDWINKLETENIKFKNLMMARYKETAQRPTIRMVNVRKDMDKAFRAMIDQIEALVLVNGIAPYEAFIKDINAVTERYKKILAQRRK